METKNRKRQRARCFFNRFRSIGRIPARFFETGGAGVDSSPLLLLGLHTAFEDCAQHVQAFFSEGFRWVLRMPSFALSV